MAQPRQKVHEIDHHRLVLVEQQHKKYWHSANWCPPTTSDAKFGSPHKPSEAALATYTQSPPIWYHYIHSMNTSLTAINLNQLFSYLGSDLNMDGLIEDADVLFPKVFQHLREVEEQSAAKVLDEELLRRAERNLDARTPRELLWRVLSTGERLLQSLQQDSRPLTRLLERTVLLIPFDDLKSTISAEKLDNGLHSPSIPVQLLCLAYLRKASDTPSGASFVACSAGLVKTLVSTWLASESTEVSERSLEDIIALLAVDFPENVTVVLTSRGPDEADGQGLFWRRLFKDPEIYSLLYQWTSLVKSNHDLKVKKGKQAVTVSQARLFDFIARVAPLDWGAITTSQHQDIEKNYSRTMGAGEQPYGGLLQYAANGMIDKEDFLMEVLRQDFFMKLLAVVEESNRRGVTPRMITAIQEGAGVSLSEDDGSNGMHL